MKSKTVALKNHTADTIINACLDILIRSSIKNHEIRLNVLPTFTPMDWLKPLIKRRMRHTEEWGRLRMSIFMDFVKLIDLPEYYVILPVFENKVNKPRKNNGYSTGFINFWAGEIIEKTTRQIKVVNRIDRRFPVLLLGDSKNFSMLFTVPCHGFILLKK